MARLSKILIVDDHPSNREWLVSLCTHLGYLPLQAADGAQALALARAEQPQLVICDILMPTMDGYEFVRQLRTDADIAATEVIFCTANYREPEVQRLASALGVSHVLIKPCEAETMIQTIRSALRQPTAPPPPLSSEFFTAEHLRLITDKLAEKGDALADAHQRLSALTELNLQLASERDPDTLLEKVCEGGRGLLGGRYAFLCIETRNNGRVIRLFSSGLTPEDAAALTLPPLAAGLFADVVNHQKSLRLSNPTGRPENIDLPPAYPIIDYAVIAPIVSPSQVYGWLCLGNTAEAGAFGEDDQRLLGILAAQVGRIYENGSLYRQMEHRNNQLMDEAEQRKRAEQKLADLIGFATDAIISANDRLKIVLFNPAAEHLFGYTADEVTGRPMLPLLPELLRSTRGRRRSPFRQPPGHVITTIGRRKDGTEFPVELSVSQTLSDGKRTFTAILRDITERQRSEQHIRRLNRVYSVLSQINSLIVRVSDAKELYRESVRIATQAGEFLRAWIAVGNRQQGQLRVAAAHAADPEYQHKLSDVLARLDDDALAVFLSWVEAPVPTIIADLRELSNAQLRVEALQSGSRAAAWLPLRVDGRADGVLVLHAESADFFDEEEMKLLEELAADIGFAMNHLQKSERLNYLAYYDELTGLANGTLFRERLNNHFSALGSGGRVALVLMDVDRFKSINDALGWGAGDSLLQQVAQRLSQACGGSEDIARLGADHFAIVLPGIAAGEDVVHTLDAHMLICFGQEFQIGSLKLRAAAKLGIALWPDDGADIDTLIKNAEAALKNAKAGVEPYLFYSDAMNNRVAERLTLESKLRAALQKQQFVLHYQPKIESRSGAIRGVEALLRWNDPETGLVPPSQFVPLLEETGLILEVGAWALRQALKDYQHWRSLDLDAPRIAVNVSAIQLRRRDFVDQFRLLLDQSGTPHGLDIEITESLIMNDTEENIAKLNAVRDLGVAIAIDDFGTGYSSLAYLVRLPVKTVKIDHSFIDQMLHDANTMTVVAAVISLSHSLGFTVVAEGVETEQQADCLKQLGCEEMQGFLFAKAMPMDSMTTLLQQRPKTRQPAATRPSPRRRGSPRGKRRP